MFVVNTILREADLFCPNSVGLILQSTYQGLQQQVQQARNPQQKSELKHKLNDIHQEISKRTQNQLQAFTEENPEIKQPESKLDQSLKR